MREIVHIEKSFCDVCGKETNELNNHKVIGRHFKPSDFEGFTNFVGYEDYDIEICNDCEKKLEEVVSTNFARVHKFDYDPNIHIYEAKNNEQ